MECQRAPSTVVSGNVAAMLMDAIAVDDKNNKTADALLKFFPMRIMVLRLRILKIFPAILSG